MIGMSSLSRRPLLFAIGISTSLASLYILSQLWFFPESSVAVPGNYVPTAFRPIKDEFLKSPLLDGDFGWLGLRVQTLTEFTAKADEIAASHRRKNDVGLLLEVEELALSMFPWLRTSSSKDSLPFRSLRQTFVPQSRGIVIPVGKGQFRFAAHLIATLRDVLHSILPIAVAYAGDEDLPSEYRDALVSLGDDISMLDVAAIFDENVIKVAGSWAIKPFAMLASTFAETILLDADTVLLQDPTVVFSYPAYKETGTYLFHDRLLWQNAFPDRHVWWEKEIGISLGDRKSNGTKPTNTHSISMSKVYMENFAEEQDSGMVVMDKSRLPIVTALLHICWQNTPSVREEYTYKMTYGDKESWWFGMELCGVDYSFEPNYGSIAGEKRGDDKVCSFTIAHPSPMDHNKLLWYNGSLLKNKAVNLTEFSIPEFWMTDATWYKGATKPDMSCMGGGEVRTMDKTQVELVKQSVKAAERIDEKFKSLTNL